MFHKLKKILQLTPFTLSYSSYLCVAFFVTISQREVEGGANSSKIVVFLTSPR
jgi:hypothetical protein